MYIKDRFHQLGLEEFDQPAGLKMNPENRSAKRSEDSCNMYGAISDTSTVIWKKERLFTKHRENDWR